MQDYMIMVGVLVEAEDEAVFNEHMPSILDTVRHALIAEHGMPADQHVGVYVLRLTPEQAQEIVENPGIGMDVAKSALSTKLK